jgi:hypothetical protein
MIKQVANYWIKLGIEERFSPFHNSSRTHKNRNTNIEIIDPEITSLSSDLAMVWFLNGPVMVKPPCISKWESNILK